MGGKGGSKGVNNVNVRPFQISSMGARSSGAGPGSLRDPTKDERERKINGVTDDDASQTNRPPTATPLPVVGHMWGVKNLTHARGNYAAPPTASPPIDNSAPTAQALPNEPPAPSPSQPEAPAPGPSSEGMDMPNNDSDTGPVPGANGPTEDGPKTGMGMDWADDEVMDFSKTPIPHLGVPPLVDNKSGQSAGGRLWGPGKVPTATQPPPRASDQENKELKERIHRREEEEREIDEERRKRLREKLRRLDDSAEGSAERLQYQEEMQKQDELDKRRKQQEALRKEWLKAQGKQRKAAIEEIRKRTNTTDNAQGEAAAKRPVQRVTAPAATSAKAEEDKRSSGKGKEQRDADWERGDRGSSSKGGKSEKGGKSQRGSKGDKNRPSKREEKR